MSEPVYAFGGRKTTTVVVYDRNKRRSAESQTIGRNVSFFSTRSRNASFIRFPTRRRRKLRATAIRFGRETTIEYYSIKRYIVVFQTIFWNDTCWILIVLTRRPCTQRYTVFHSNPTPEFVRRTRIVFDLSTRSIYRFRRNWACAARSGPSIRVL